MEQETYPLILDGESAGEVAVRRTGGWTFFDVRCTGAASGIVRVSVYGGGREGYLGVLAPEGDGMVLQRRLSRLDLRGFPEQIAYAGRAGQPLGAESEPDEPESTEAETAAFPAAQAPEENAEPVPPAQDAQAGPDTRQEEPPELEDVYWYASPDGALVAFDGEQNMIALPAGDPRIPGGPGGWPRRIEGRDYVVYRTKDGRLIR